MCGGVGTSKRSSEDQRENRQEMQVAERRSNGAKEKERMWVLVRRGGEKLKRYYNG